MKSLPMIAAALVAFIFTSLLGLWLIPLLKRLKFGQTILEIGPRWHKDKQGTPTMGGILFVIGILLGAFTGTLLIITTNSDTSVMGGVSEISVLLLGLAMAFGFGLIGFVDDYIKVAKKRNLGLTERQKLVMQFVVAILYMLGLYFLGATSTYVDIPFVGQFNFGILYYPIMILGIVFLINAVNFTDGVDGLCSSVTMVVALGFLFVAGMLRYAGMQMLAAALAGGCMGFLVWNFHPAKVFMGDTGSFFLGGMVVALAFGIRLPAFLLLFGFIYAVEAISVMIQQTYFKYTRRKYGEGRRIFKMTPIHHHFEMSGWSENKIVAIFSGIQVVFCVLAVLAVLQMIS